MTLSPHIPVMTNEVLEYLQPSPGKVIVDATVGSAGHTKILAEQGAKVIGIDRDQEILEFARQNLGSLISQVTLKYGQFSQIKELVGNSQVDGILFDLGVSSLQLDTPARGFSFRHDAQLDMRMDKNLSVTAKDLINGLGRKELHELFQKLAEEQHPQRLVNAILESRRLKPITTTKQLADLIAKVKKSSGKIHPATKIFQALRIAVNDELNQLKAALPSALSLLKAGGVCVVISFHSLEDRIVKQIFRRFSSQGYQLLTKKPLRPTPQEIADNPRSRSAKLRAIQRQRSHHAR